MKKPFFLNFVIIGVLLSGCVETTNYRYKNNTKPYTVGGKTYYPMASANGFTETGVASWYGPGFHGKKTASGERYNQNAFTAAHKTLPFGTNVRVTNLDNGKNTTVVINDRGPFKTGRIIDLSNAAAKQLGVVGTGTARVKIKAVGSTGYSTTTQKASVSQSSSASGKYYVQIGAYSSRANADNAARALSGAGYGYSVKSGKNGNYAVMAGPYSSRSAAESARNKLRQKYSGAFIVD